MVRLWGLFTLTRRRNILATYLSNIRRNVNQYSITTTYDLIIEQHENANLDIKHKSQIPITNNCKNKYSLIIVHTYSHVFYLFPFPFYSIIRIVHSPKSFHKNSQLHKIYCYYLLFEYCMLHKPKSKETFASLRSYKYKNMRIILVQIIQVSHWFGLSTTLHFLSLLMS